MAKLTVYVPDELLDRSRALNPNANTSQLVQRGLERLSPAEDAVYARRPEDAAELLAAAAGKLREGAARQYENGYREALVMVSEAGEGIWPGLRSLADRGFDLKRWTQFVQKGLAMLAAGPSPFEPPEWYQPFLEYLGTMLDVIDDEAYSFTPSGPYIRGFQAALRDAWETAERPEASDAPGGNADTGDGEEVAAPAT